MKVNIWNCKTLSLWIISKKIYDMWWYAYVTGFVERELVNVYIWLTQLCLTYTALKVGGGEPSYHYEKIPVNSLLMHKWNYVSSKLENCMFV